ncbi:hypothetical protein GSI_11942 [Ganoderma sinense ZZ0214-1]|uniref:Granulins domain-containing protein n=1 Tax=Ganoderma sinense ZZ0214-1 TaxID=1077348 RepID=A0A2G8RXG8_9APHY|nr:hypothetical protein GSI_11942 [Ganoderma sinense ZZ0214-1]
MPSPMYIRPLAFFLAAAALLSQTEAAAPPAGDFCSSLWLPKGAIVNGTHVLGVHDTSDGCPVGWVECSAYTCYPLDGSTCCSDGNFCPPGYYCDSGGCCPNGKVCGGAAPPPSTINGGTFTTTSTFVATTPVTTPRTSTAFVTTPSATFSTAVVPPPVSTGGVSVGFSTPLQTTEFGTVPANTATGLNTIATGAPTTAGPTSGIGVMSAASRTHAPLDARVGLWLAGLVAAAMVISGSSVRMLGICHKTNEFSCPPA